MIYQLLMKGEGNAIPSRHLEMLTGMSRRMVAFQVERERRQGFPICASTDAGNYGFYLAENEEELARYCKVLHHRANELTTTADTMMANPIWVDPGEVEVQKHTSRHTSRSGQKLVHRQAQKAQKSTLSKKV